MAVADASLSKIKYFKESSFGVYPTASAYQIVRIVNDTLGENKEVVQADEILGDRMPVSNIQVGIGAGGDIVGELSHGTYDDWFQAALLSAPWTTKVENSVSSTFAAGAGSTGTLTRGSGDWVADGYTVGSWVRISGAATAAHNGYWKLAGVTTTVLTCAVGPQFGAEGPVSVTVQQLSEIVNGSTLDTYSLAREYGGLTNEWAIDTGIAFQGFDIRARGKDKVGITFTTLGKQEETVTSDPSSGDVAATTTKVYSTTSDVVLFAVNNVPGFMTNFELSYRNGLYVLDEEAGSLGPIGIGQGTIELTGQHEFYYKVGTDFADYAAGSFGDVPYAIALEDAAGNGYVFDITAANQTSGRRAIPGKDQAVKGQHEYRGFKEGTQSLMIRIQRTS